MRYPINQVHKVLAHIQKWLPCLIALIAVQFSMNLSAQSDSFPTNWEGDWIGTLEIYAQNKKRQEVPMQISIQAIDSNRWQYLTLYSPSKNPLEKAYELQAVAPDLGQYVIDEKNGIIIDAQYQGDCLYSAFEVMGNYLQSRMCYLGHELHYEITSGPASPKKTTGDTIIGSDTIPPVQVFSRPSVQRAILKKVSSP
jgi:hypothetical protein